MAKNKCSEYPMYLSGWLVLFTDLMLLLFTFNIGIIANNINSVSSDTIFKDAWDISGLRFSFFVKKLISNKIDSSILNVSAYGSYHPKSDIISHNRKVEMRLFSQYNRRDILKQENFFDRLE